MGVISMDELVALESKVWDALRTGDASADLESRAEAFLGVYPSGFADRSDHADQLADGPTIAEFEIVCPHVVVLSGNDVLFAYRANFRRPGPASPRESMFVSSVWSQRAGHWVNVFSQDTPVETHIDV